jgi:hypothetical protein
MNYPYAEATCLRQQFLLILGELHFSSLSAGLAPAGLW